MSSLATPQKNVVYRLAFSVFNSWIPVGQEFDQIGNSDPQSPFAQHVQLLPFTHFLLFHERVH